MAYKPCLSETMRDDEEKVKRKWDTIGAALFLRLLLASMLRQELCRVESHASARQSVSYTPIATVVMIKVARLTVGLLQP